MRLHELYPFAEERKQRKRVGRGSGSGLGKTSGRGHKGQNLKNLLAAFADKNEISLDDIYERGLAKPGSPVKILAVGDLDRALTIEAHRFSESAIAKIKTAGGAVKALEQTLEG